mmetsp:Transcript_6531/g.16089  ORF Transcript_6531/g.16089 Transcript_6531/m.16089 type:complete len:262 (+) Transcript_6531:56-841(+)
MPVDYSKFANIEDSDEEREEQEQKQREEMKKEMEIMQGRPADKPAARPAKTEVVKDDEDEKIEWYRHREWKPAEPKQEFAPSKLDQPVAVANDVGTQKKAEASQWNVAGTWEERNMIGWAKAELASLLVGVSADMDGKGLVKVDKIDSIEGDCSIPIVRGRPRYIFDLCFTVHFVAETTIDGKSGKSKGTIKFEGFSHDDFEDEGCRMALKFTDEKSVGAAEKRVVVEACGATRRAVEQGHGLCAAIHTKLATFASSLEKQ